MNGKRRFFLLTYMVAVAIHISLTFNIDTTYPDVYTGKQNDFFGYKVLQFMSDTSKGIIVTAPLQLNGSGGICKPILNQTIHQCFNPKEIHLSNVSLPLKHFGLSIAENPRSSEFTVCSPSVAHECYENSYLNSACFKMTGHLKPISPPITPTFQGCTKRTVDLVFLFDGSRSMTEGEFNNNKYFIKDIMKSLLNTSIKFAAVQFSTDYNKVFDFRDYQAGRALDKLSHEPHMKSLTNTHKALKFVLEEIFENPAAGASPDATNVLVLITDGDPSDSDRDQIIKRYDDKKIIRFVIGVKDANLTKFKDIASEPKENNAFKIENYDGLTGILGNFQKKIFTMEGSTVALAGNMINEMSQSGFSAVFHNDTLILGSVGSNNWLGSLQEIHGQQQTQIEDPLMGNDSYMGYSVTVGERNKSPLYFTGAPRFEHTGQVILFRREDKKWTVSQRINGDRIGSYFGAELCSVDVNSDGNTDFLLVGAPLFYQPQEKTEGQIYIFTLTDQMQLRSPGNVTAPSMGRFGTTISSLADLNGDGLRDVAVGAPLEDDNSGAVYIYLGDRHTGIRSTFSQRIVGTKIKPGIRFFGQAIDGDIDLGEDGLPDILIGSQGTAVVLRSRPVFNIVAHLSFEPGKISTEKIDCVGKTEEYLPMVTLTVCFEMVENTKRRAGVMSSGLNISYKLDVDPMRQTYRGFFNQTKGRARNFTSTRTLTRKDTCFNHSIYMPKCVRDTLSPIPIKLNFIQGDSESASAVLSVDSKRQASVEVPFEKQCSKNDTCIAELEVDFNFTTKTLLVKEDNYFILSIQLRNHGDASYNTSLTMHYPPGLSFSRMTSKTLHICHDLEDVLDKTICGVSLPVYRSKSLATFNSSFHIISDYEWNDTVSVTVTGQSDNTNSSRTLSLTKNISVQFEIKMAVTVKEDSVTYLNFTTEDAGPKQIVNIFKIDNHGSKPFPVSVALFFPTRLEHGFEIKIHRVTVQENKTQCTDKTSVMPKYCSEEKKCMSIVCDSFILDKSSATEFTLWGDVEFKDHKQKKANMTFLKQYSGDGGRIKFKSFIRVDYNKHRYVLNSHRQQEKSANADVWKDNDPTVKQVEVLVEFILPPNKMLIILTGTLLGFLLLIIIAIIMCKCGCFKRKTIDEMEEAKAAALAASAPTEPAASQPETGSKSDQPSEEKHPLNDGSSTGVKGDDADCV